VLPANFTETCGYQQSVFRNIIGCDIKKTQGTRHHTGEYRCGDSTTIIFACTGFVDYDNRFE
jgi:hypothetical protein